jgi:hypothetical protein
MPWLLIAKLVVFGLRPSSWLRWVGHGWCMFAALVVLNLGLALRWSRP